MHTLKQSCRYVLRLTGYGSNYLKKSDPEQIEIIESGFVNKIVDATDFRAILILDSVLRFRMFGIYPDPSIFKPRILNSAALKDKCNWNPKESLNLKFLQVSTNFWLNKLAQ